MLLENIEQIQFVDNNTDGKVETNLSYEYERFIDEYNEKFQSQNDELKDSVMDLKVRKLLIAIEKGNYLTKIKKQLKDKIIDKVKEWDLFCKKLAESKRNINRYIELCSDTRITKLTQKDLKTMKSPSMSKLQKMSSLNDIDFKKVLKGNDSPLNVLKNEPSKEEKEAKEFLKQNEKVESIQKLKKVSKNILIYELAKLQRELYSLSNKSKNIKTTLYTKKSSTVEG